MNTRISFEALPLTPEQSAAHERALLCAKRFHLAEKDLLLAIMEADRLRIYEKFGETHLTPYCEKYLKLSGDVAGTYVRVARKASELPALLDAVANGKIPISKARTITALLTKENCETWIRKAETLSKTQLEREVANATPGGFTAEKVRPIEGDNFQVQLILTKEQMELLQRARQLMAEKAGKRYGYARTIELLLKDFLEAHDPVRRAGRAKSNKSDPSRDGSPKLSARIKHAVHRRDQGRCQAILPDGQLCGSTRWIHLHHIRPKSEGGKDIIENLTTLCSAHHRQWHNRHSAARDFSTASRSSPETGSSAKSTR